MVCHTRSLRDSRREKRQNTGGSSSGLSTMEGSRSSSRTDAEKGAGPTRTTSEEVPVHTRTTSEEVRVQMDNLDSAGNSGDVAFAFHDDSVGAGGGSYTQNDGLTGALRFEIDSLRMENELLRQRLTTLGRLATLGGSTGPSSPVPVPEPRRIEEMTSSKDVDDTDGAAEVFFPEEAPGDDRGPLNCFNATHSMYIGDAWSMEIIQAYRERVAAQGAPPVVPSWRLRTLGRSFGETPGSRSEWWCWSSSLFGSSRGPSSNIMMRGKQCFGPYLSSSPYGRTRAFATSSRTAAWCWRKADADARA